MISNQNLINMRQEVIRVYKMYERLIIPIARFLLVFVVASGINNSIGYASVVNNLIIEVALGVLGIVLPANLIILLFMILASIHLLVLDLVVGIGSVLLFFVLYVLFVRLFPKESLLIVFTMLALPFNLGVMVVIIAGLFCGLAGMVAIAIGILLDTLRVPIVHTMQGISIEEMSQTVEQVKVIFSQNVIGNEAMLLTIIVYMLVFLSVYIIRRQSIDYARFVAVGVGASVHIVGFLLINVVFGIESNVFLLLIMTILSIIVASICIYMSRVIDYSRVEMVQFEDEDNYYYVKVVPKIYLKQKSKKTVRAVYGAKKSLEEE